MSNQLGWNGLQFRLKVSHIFSVLYVILFESPIINHWHSSSLLHAVDFGQQERRRSTSLFFAKETQTSKSAMMLRLDLIMMRVCRSGAVVGSKMAWNHGEIIFLSLSYWLTIGISLADHFSIICQFFWIFRLLNNFTQAYPFPGRTLCCPSHFLGVPLNFLS
jgi:hypothetical protein